MEDYLHQKIYFQETYLQYPNLNYNQILVNICEKFNLKKISYTCQNFNVFKSNYQKKIYNNKSIDEKLSNIKLYGKILLKCNMIYYDINNHGTEKYYKIFATNNSISLLNSSDINQYYIDCTYKCIPNELNTNSAALLVLIGYNYKLDKFQLILVALLSNENTDIFIHFYNFLKNAYYFSPKKIMVDFSLSNLNALIKSI